MPLREISAEIQVKSFKLPFITSRFYPKIPNNLVEPFLIPQFSDLLGMGFIKRIAPMFSYNIKVAEHLSVISKSKILVYLSIVFYFLPSTADLIHLFSGRGVLSSVFSVVYYKILLILFQLFRDRPTFASISLQVRTCMDLEIEKDGFTFFLSALKALFIFKYPRGREACQKYIIKRLGFSTGRSGTRLSDPAKMLKPYFHL
jgi:hypothetical protein